MGRDRTRTRSRQSIDTSPPPAFDRASLALSGWWKDFSAAPWAPSASAGSSGSNGNLDEATHPPTAGTPVNGLTPAVFNGTNAVLFSDNNADSFWTVSAYSGWALVYANSVSSNDLIADEVHTNDPIISSGGATTLWGVHLMSSGKVGVYHYDGTLTGVLTDFVIGQWNLVQWKYDGTDLKLRVNGSSRVSVARSSITTLARVLEVGFSSANSLFLDGSILELATVATALSDADEDSVLSSIRAEYGLALT